MSENVVKLENNFNQVIERKIAVIFVTDVVGFSKLMEINEDETLKSFRACKDILDKLFNEHGGRIFNTAGDSVLAEFQSAVSAVVCANEFQKLLKERNNSVSDDAKMYFRIGLNMGDVIVEGENLYGDGVNVASRLEALSQPSGVCLSKSIMDFVNKKTELLFNDLGEQKVKNTLVHAFDLDNPDLDKRSNIDETVTSAASAKINEGSVPPTIAVLPFVNLSTDEEQEFFADGITEDTISYFSKSKTLPIVSINSVMSYKNTKDNSTECVNLFVSELEGMKINLDLAEHDSYIALTEAMPMMIISSLLSISNDSSSWKEVYKYFNNDDFKMFSSPLDNDPVKIFSSISTNNDLLLDWIKLYIGELVKIQKILERNSEDEIASVIRKTWEDRLKIINNIDPGLDSGENIIPSSSENILSLFIGSRAARFFSKSKEIDKDKYGFEKRI